MFCETTFNRFPINGRFPMVWKAGSAPVLGIALSTMLLAGCSENPSATPEPPAAVTVSVLVPPQSGGAVIHGMNGIGWGKADGMIYAISSASETIYRVDPSNGTVEIAIGPPDGEGDDVAMGPDGALAWTAVVSGELRYKAPNGPVQVLATDVPRINPVAFRDDGRLVAAQTRVADTLYELYPSSGKPPRVIKQNFTDLNSFDFGPDGLLYAPAIEEGKIVTIDIDTGEMKYLAEGFGRLASVKMNSQGDLIALQSRVGHIDRVDPATGKAERIVTVPPIVDNTINGPDDMIYVSSPPDSSILKVHPETGEVSYLVHGRFGALGALAMAKENNQDRLLAADGFGFRSINPVTGEVVRKPYRQDLGLSGGRSSNLAVNETHIALSNVRSGVVQLTDRATDNIVYESRDIEHPYGIAFLDDGALAVADYTGDRIVRVDQDGTTILAEGLGGPVGVTRGSDGSLLVAEALSGIVSRIDPVTGQRTELITGLNQPESVAILNDGRFVVVEQGTKTVTAIDPVTGARTVLAENLPLGAHISETPDPVGLPAGLAVGSDGAVYVSCDGDYSIRKITFGG